MRSLTTLLLVFFMIGFVNAQTPVVFNQIQGPLTSMSVDHETFNWGAITAGEKVKVVFTITNTGVENLIIANVKGSCGCTVPEWPKEAIKPGKSATITAVFDSAGKAGDIAKKITITANTDPADSYLTIQGKVREKTTGISGRPAINQVADDLFSIGPNPAVDFMTVTTKSDEELNYFVFDAMGSNVSSGKLNKSTQIELSTYPAGVYTILVKSDGKAHLAKQFVVNK